MTRHTPERRASRPLLALSLGALALSACAKPAPKPQRPPISVAVAAAHREDVPYTIEANGIVTPMQSANVTSQVDGLVQQVLFTEGQEVQKGQTLFKIDPRPYQNAYDQARATLARDKATAANAQTEYQRYQQLHGSGIVTTEEIDSRRATFESTSAILQSDSAVLATAKFNLDNTTIKAPIAGRTGSVLVREGNQARAAGNAAMVVINQVHPILVRFAVPGSQLPVIMEHGGRGGLPVRIVPSGAAAADTANAGSKGKPMDADMKRATGTVDVGAGNARGGREGGRQGARTGSGGGSGGAGGSGEAAGGGARGGRGGRGGGRGGAGGNSGGGRSSAGAAVRGADDVVGSLSFIDNAVDTTTGTVQLKAVFGNSSGLLWPGQFVATQLRLFVEPRALVVPSQAVQTGQRGTYVYVVDTSLKAEQRFVTVERTAGTLSIITNGLSEGEKVVTDGQSRLTPGATVDLRSPTGEGGGRRGGRGRGGRGGDSTAAGGAAGDKKGPGGA